MAIGSLALFYDFDIQGIDSGSVLTFPGVDTSLCSLNTIDVGTTAEEIFTQKMVVGHFKSTTGHNRQII